MEIAASESPEAAMISVIAGKGVAVQ